ncbi:hypothetical protein HQ520_08620 [bacterium]|nr:hypothetical protein [bacterium]
MKEKWGVVPGFTLRSVTIGVFLMLVTATFVMFAEIVGSPASTTTDLVLPSLAGTALPLPAMMILVPFLLLVAGVFAAMRFRLLTKAEMVCVLFMMLLSAPIMSAGFWRLMLTATATIPRTGDFEKLDAFSDNLWPHGPNLLEEALVNAEGTRISGNVSWQELKSDSGEMLEAPVVQNRDPREVSSLRIRVPLRENGSPWLKQAEPHMLNVLARAQDMGPTAKYFIRIYYDNSQVFADEPVTANSLASRNYLHPQGFVRIGTYGLQIPTTVRDYVDLEFGLSGVGRVEFLDPQLMNVSTLESAYRGRRVVTQAVYDSLPEAERFGLVVKPGNMLSLEGLKYLLKGYIPVRDWAGPVGIWAAFIVLLLTATFATASIMRRQWIQSERYPLPMAQIPNLILGVDSPGDSPSLPPVWRNRAMWIGFGVALFWVLMKGWSSFNPDVPNMNLSVALKPYFNDPSWGKMWEVTFSVSAIFLALALFMELNVLMSLVVGFFIYRAQFWFGEANGLAVDTTYPYREHQQMFAYIMYALLILIFTRKYLWRVAIHAIKGDTPAGEAISYRAAFLALIGSFAAICFWALWAGLPTIPILVLFLILVSIGFVAAKLRAECGAPYAYYYPMTAMVIVPLLGGMAFFQPKGVVFLVLVSLLIVQRLFFLVPGLQIEFIEFGHRLRIKSSHIVLACLLGVLGGIFIGGWAYLSNCHSVGAENFESKDMTYDIRNKFPEYNKALSRATREYVTGEGEAEAGGGNRQIYAGVYAAGGTLITAVLRQMFAGFWFHPAGFIFGPTDFLGSVWGSLLAAWFIRMLVLRMGGAVTVRNRLLPFAVGVFLGGILGQIIFALINVYLFFFFPGAIRFGGIL